MIIALQTYRDERMGWRYARNGVPNMDENDTHRHTMPHTPQKPDCRGWVFAVFAKIPPPIAHTRGHIRSAYLMRGRGVCSDVACRVAVWCLVPNCCGVLRRA